MGRKGHKMLSLENSFHADIGHPIFYGPIIEVLFTLPEEKLSM